MENYSIYNESGHIYNDSDYPLVPRDVALIKQLPYMIAIYSIVYGLVFIFAVIGNGLVLTLIYKDPSMRNVTNYFILNMAVADLLVAVFCIPMTLLANIFSGWRFGAFLCKSVPYVQQVVQCASVNTLAAIAIDRFLAICYVRHSKITGCASRTTIIFIWIFAMTVAVPLLVFTQHFMHPDYNNVPMCHQLWPSFELQRGYFLFAFFIACYVVPLLMIVVCYVLIGHRIYNRQAPGIEHENGRHIIQKSKMKVLKMLAVIVILFALSWLPLYAIWINLFYFSSDLPIETRNVIGKILLPIAQWLGAANSGVNPIIYCFFSKKYRRGFRKIIYCSVFRRLSRGQSQTQSQCTRYVPVDTSAAHDAKRLDGGAEKNKISTNKYMVVAFCNGKMTVTFKKENSDKDEDSSF